MYGKVTVFKDWKKAEIDYTGVLVGFSSEGDKDEIYPMAIILVEDNSFRTAPVYCVKVDSYLRY